MIAPTKKIAQIALWAWCRNCWVQTYFHKGEDGDWYCSLCKAKLEK